ncbi:hypothetical protein [Microvirga sp. VF16]|uniref:hypothetical protein n=1 Tax=Microvirga sp. VF16 TaxID=2807101 RepID=UPI00193E3C29|nr:hypothetical protein [Microvirga sp. VF16]QRM35078.1 hypothetical protein JO965_39440 [Microvirga sp. VF16]
MTSPIPRSSRIEVRNPILALPAFKAVYSLSDETKLVLASLLDNLSKDAESKAQASWLKKKGPMAAYWKACAVYAKHIARAIRKSCHTGSVLSSTNSEKLTPENEKLLKDNEKRRSSISTNHSFEAHNENNVDPARAA